MRVIVASNPIDDNITKYSGFVAISPCSISGATLYLSAAQTNENSIQPVQTNIPPSKPIMVANVGCSFFFTPQISKATPATPIKAAPISLYSTSSFSFNTIMAWPIGMSKSTNRKEKKPFFNPFIFIVSETRLMSYNNYLPLLNNTNIHFIRN